MVSAREAGFNLRESWPLTRQALQNQDCNVLDNRVSERSHSGGFVHEAYRGWRLPFTSPKDSSGKAGEWAVTPAYPDDVRDTSERGMGCQANRHLRCLAESNHENVGGCQRDAKGSRPPMPEEVSSQNDQALCTGSVGVAIALGARESQGHGEGPQSVGKSQAEVTEC